MKHSMQKIFVNKVYGVWGIRYLIEYELIATFYTV